MVGRRIFQRKRATSGVAIVALIVASIGLFASPAAAAKPVRLQEHRLAMVCEEPPVTNEAGTAIVSLFVSDTDGPSAVVLFWEAPATPESDEPTLRSTTGEDQVTVTPGHMESVVALEDSLGVPAGNAVVSVDLVPVGEPEVGEKSREGNRTIRDRTVLQNLVVESGTLTLPDGTVFDLTGCPGGDLTIDVFITQPDAFVRSFAGILVLCDITTEDYHFELGASAEEAGTSAVAFFTNADGALEGFDTKLTLTPEGFGGTIQLESSETGSPAGPAVIDVTFTPGPRTVIRRQQDNTRSTMTGRLLEPLGTVTIPTKPETVIDMSSCFAFDGREHIVETHPGHPEDPEE